MTLTIATLASGAMGAGVGARLAQNGAIVLTPLAGRSNASRARAEAAGMRDANDAEIAAADIILSIVPPAVAEEFAQRLASALKASTRKALYIDCNAVAPATVRRIAETIAASGAEFLDAGIIGGPPVDGQSGPRFYVSGDNVARAKALTAYGLDIRVMVDSSIGDASALKMCYGALNKGKIALAAMAAQAAIDAGIGDTFRAELEESQALEFVRLQRSVPDMLPKAYRWDAEMDEVAAFFREDAARKTYHAIADHYRGIARDVADNAPAFAQLRAFYKRTPPPLSTPKKIAYGQRFEDIHLMRAFGDQPRGFYIDVGAGHPVVDNVSFLFYLKGWRGITVEPNPKLSRLSRAVRVRDAQQECVAGAAIGDATFYEVNEFHGFSTTLAAHATKVLETYGNPSVASRVPMTTLAALCAEHAPQDIDFLKIDVEGAEGDVLAGNDWQRYRPKIVLAEALAPVTQEPAWEAWEPILTRNGYRFAFFDSLNRYYVAEEAAHLAGKLAAAPENFDDYTQIGMFGGAEGDERHPDHALARRLSAGVMTLSPFIDAEQALTFLISHLTEDQLLAPANETEFKLLAEILFGGVGPSLAAEFSSASNLQTMRDLYAFVVRTETFRTACGQISASYAW